MHFCFPHFAIVNAIVWNTCNRFKSCAIVWRGHPTFSKQIPLYFLFKQLAIRLPDPGPKCLRCRGVPARIPNRRILGGSNYGRCDLAHGKKPESYSTCFASARAPLGESMIRLLVLRATNKKFPNLLQGCQVGSHLWHNPRCKGQILWRNLYGIGQSCGSLLGASIGDSAWYRILESNGKEFVIDSKNLLIPGNYFGISRDRSKSLVSSWGDVAAWDLSQNGHLFKKYH